MVGGGIAGVEIENGFSGCCTVGEIHDCICWVGNGTWTPHEIVRKSADLAVLVGGLIGQSKIVVIARTPDMADPVSDGLRDRSGKGIGAAVDAVAIIVRVAYARGVSRRIGDRYGVTKRIVGDMLRQRTAGGARVGIADN